MACGGLLVHVTRTASLSLECEATPQTAIVISRTTVLILCALLFLPALLPAQSADLAAKAQRGKQAMAAGRFDQAASIYGELVQAIPDNAGLLMNLGMARHMAGRDRESIPLFEQATRLAPTLFPAWLFWGAAHLRLGEPENAVRPLEKAVKLGPDQAQARQMLGEAYLNLGRYAPAAKHFSRLIQLHPTRPAAFAGLGQSYEGLSQQAFEQLEKTEPDSPYVLVLVADTLVSQQKYSGAFSLYRRALEKQSRLRGAHAALAEVYRRTDHPEWAAAEEQKERDLTPLDCRREKLACAFAEGQYRELVSQTEADEAPASYYWLVRAYDRLAVEAFSRLGQLPASAERHQVMAQIHSNQGRYVEASREWRAALEMQPGNPLYWGELATALYRGRDYEAAESLLRKLLQKEPRSAQWNFLLGDTLLNRQQAEAAISLLNEAVKLDPQMLPAHHSLGRALMQTGQDQRAIPHLKIALPIDEDGSLHYQLASAYQSTGQRELAREALRKYQEIQRTARAEILRSGQEIQITAP